MMNTIDIKDVKRKVEEAKGFLFDFDGTLVNLDKLNVDAFALVFKDMFDLEFTKDDFMTYISGRGSKNGLVEYLGMKGIKDFSPEEINRQFYIHKKRFIEEEIDDEIYLLPGIREFLEYEENSKKRNVIVTSSREEHVKRMLTHFKLFNSFEKVFDRFTVVRGKPASEGFLKGIEYLGLKVEECIAFEDSFYGLQAAKGAGLYTIGILNRGWNDDFVYQLSDFVIESYTELITPS